MLIGGVAKGCCYGLWVVVGDKLESPGAKESCKGLAIAINLSLLKY